MDVCQGHFDCSRPRRIGLHRRRHAVAGAPLSALGEISNTRMFGRLLYTKYIYYFQAAGLVLLVAMIGAIVLTLRTRKGVRRQKVPDQLRRTRAASVKIKKVETGKGI